MRIRVRRLLGATAAAIGLLLLVLIVLAAASGVHVTRLRWDEPAELARRLAISPGMRVADIGAGSGWLAVGLARRVGPDGHVYATELAPAKLEAIRRSARAAGVANLTVLPARLEATGLPPSCCEVIYLRYVYHHLARPQALNASLYESLAPGGRLGIIDFEPRGLFRWMGSSPGRSGHGVPRETVREEVEAAGFRLVEAEPRWGRVGYLLVFTR
jgi:predicted methyltransferase